MRHTTHFIFMKGRSSKVYPLRYYGYCWCVWTASRYLQFRSLKKLTRRHNTRYSIQKKEMNMPVGKSKKIYNVSRYCIKTLRSCQLDAIIHLKKKKMFLNIYRHTHARTNSHKKLFLWRAFRSRLQQQWKF